MGEEQEEKLRVLEGSAWGALQADALSHWTPRGEARFIEGQ